MIYLNRQKNKIENFSKLIQKYTDQLIKGLSIEKVAIIDHLDLNRQAILLAQEEMKVLK